MEETVGKAELPRYKCHKEVQALKIEKIEFLDSGDAIISNADNSFHPVTVDKDFVLKHKPEVGGYRVFYKDGYASYSPEKAFEEGYTKI